MSILIPPMLNSSLIHNLSSLHPLKHFVTTNLTSITLTQFICIFTVYLHTKFQNLSHTQKMLNIIIAHFHFLTYTSHTPHKENSGTAQVCDVTRQLHHWLLRHTTTNLSHLALYYVITVKYKGIFIKYGCACHFTSMQSAPHFIQITNCISYIHLVKSKKPSLR
jgi:hypothetical protein